MDIWFCRASSLLVQININWVGELTWEMWLTNEEGVGSKERA